MRNARTFAILTALNIFAVWSCAQSDAPTATPSDGNASFGTDPSDTPGSDAAADPSDSSSDASSDRKGAADAVAVFVDGGSDSSAQVDASVPIPTMDGGLTCPLPPGTILTGDCFSRPTSCGYECLPSYENRVVNCNGIVPVRCVTVKTATGCACRLQ